MSTADFRFQPPDRRQIWQNLALTMSQAAALTGVSERQIQHWLDKGYIKAQDGGGRKMNGESLDAIMLIKQARAAGIPLRHAVPLAQEFLSREASGVLDSEMAHWALQDLREKLRDAQTGIEGILRVIQGLERSDGHFVDRPVPSVTRNRV